MMILFIISWKSGTIKKTVVIIVKQAKKLISSMLHPCQLSYPFLPCT